MSRLIDMTFLLFLGTLLLIKYEPSYFFIIVILVTCIIASFGLFLKKPLVQIGLSLAFSIACLFVPSFLLLSGPVLYIACNEKKHIACAITAFPLLIFFINPSEKLPLSALFFVLFSYCLALYFFFTTSKREHVETQLIRIRDTSTELQMALEEKNKNLIAKQDSDIYSATLKERNRIAREIHDNVGHLLTRSILQIGALLAVNKNTGIAPPLEALKETLNLAMNNIRESVHDLHDESIDLKHAIEDILTNSQGFKIDLDYDIENHLSRTLKYTFISIIKEAVTNMEKHSNGTKGRILLREHPGMYQLTIEDNGNATLPDTTAGIGLENIKHRVDALKGTIHISTDSGFKIMVTFNKTFLNGKEYL